MSLKSAARSIKILIETKENIKKQIYNIGFDDQNYSIEEIGKIVCSKLPESRIEYSENKNDVGNLNWDDASAMILEVFHDVAK